MSPNLKGTPRPGRPRAQGFTLTEVLVSIAIFVTVISGVFVLYSGAVETVRLGNQAMTMMDEASSSLRVLQDDLQVAYSSREFGDPNQFYGRPEGFMFVGRLSTGTQGRVTYVINPYAGTEGFISELSESYTDTRERVYAQVDQAAFRAALGAGMDSAAAESYGQLHGGQAELAFDAIYGPEPADPDQSTPKNEASFVFPVNVTTYSMLRYEEPGVGDLDTFNLPTAMAVEWPAFDNNSPQRDTPVGDGGPSDQLYGFLKSALGDRANDPTATTNATNGDLRDLIPNFFNQTPTSYAAQPAQLYAVTTDKVRELVANKRREYWIRLLADDPAIVQPDGNVNPDGNGFSPRFWNNNPGLTANDTDRPYAPDYVLTEKILNRATLRDPNTGDPLTFSFPNPAGGPDITLVLDGLKVPGVFNYGYDQADFGETNFLNGFANTLERVDGYMGFFNNPDPVTLKDFDSSLQATLINGGNSLVYAGSAFVPRIPALVQIRFWLCDEKVLPSAPDFRRLFTQVVQVPAGTSSTAGTQAEQAAQAS